jgi:hypothetical protein
VITLILNSEVNRHVQSSFGNGAESSRAGFQLLADDATQGVLQPRRLSLEIFPQRPVDEGLIAGCAPGLLRHLQKAIHNVLIEPDGNPHFAFGLRFRRKNSSPFAPAEIVALFHRSASYLFTFLGRGGTRGNDADVFSAPGVNDHEHTTERADASATNRRSCGSDSSSIIVIA